VQLNQVIDYIHEHLDQDLSLNRMAAIVQMSPTYFASLFKRSTGLSPYQYVVPQRINRAKMLLLTSNRSIANIATQVGFYDQSYLTRHMQRLLGVTPKQLRRHQQ
jgi:AraC family transcriptional regulator